MVLPRALFHASLAFFDGPIMTLWFASVYAYLRCLDGRAWPWQAGVSLPAGPPRTLRIESPDRLPAVDAPA